MIQDELTRKVLETCIEVGRELGAGGNPKLEYYRVHDERLPADPVHPVSRPS